MNLSKQYSFWGSSLIFLICLCVSVYVQQPIVLLAPFVVIGVIMFTSITPVWYLLVTLLALSFEYNITDYLGLDVPDELLMLLLSFAFLGLCITKSITIPHFYSRHIISTVLAVSLFWTLITVSFSGNLVVSLKYLAAKIWYIIPFVILPWFILKTKKDISIFITCLIVPIVCTCFYTMFRHAQLGFLFDNINTAVAPFYRNHVSYSAMLVCSIPILFGIYKLTTIVKIKKYLLGLLLFTLAALFFSYSRGAWLALVIGAVVYVCIPKKIVSLAFLMSLFVLIIGISWLAKENRYLNYHSNYKKTIYHANFNDHIQATFAGTDMSNAERFNRWIAGIRMCKEHPLVGFGPNTFYDNYKPYIVSYFKTWVSSNKEKSTVHNYFLLVLIEQGIPGLFLFVLLVYTSFRRVEYLYAILSNVFYKTAIRIIGVVLAMIVTLNLLSDLIESDKIGSLFYLCLGLIIVIEVKAETKNKPTL
jgi:O-antigen ligase